MHLLLGIFYVYHCIDTHTQRACFGCRTVGDKQQQFRHHVSRDIVRQRRNKHKIIKAMMSIMKLQISIINIVKLNEGNKEFLI